MKSGTKKAVLLAGVGVLVVIGILALLKFMQIRAMIDKAKHTVPPPETVTTAQVARESWENTLTAVGTLTAVQGVTVAAELAGKVADISFESGKLVRKGEPLLRQDISSEAAQLPGAEAQESLTRLILERDAKMLPRKIISQNDYDTAVANHRQAISQANNIRATIGKKTIRAPFTGRAGIRQVNLGQMLREGDPIVTLQTLNPIYADFAIPQQEIGRLNQGLPVRVTCDSLPGVVVTGRVSAINPIVDTDTRNVRLRATLTNASERLRPGLFVNVAVGLPVRQQVLIIPTTSVLYNPYGDSVFIVAADPKHKGGFVLRQQFVRLGEKRGDFVAVLSGVNQGDVVVSTGVFKLRNGQSVVVNNKLSPSFQTAPKPEDS
ncbi:efflux RND transporter periplasmic adaptor subunit [Geomesophilobacter sediminis]|uniref:Efflux RND transporter periplasmic adaptor subunit n=1 Tax=Geomesophilobacter sediminis TaxID=2798584 RepID=A0A8J7M1C9_9BACT|nr:efflux RND transporter periplasmic adaptor subunit [Geomesophilobacter sediminis]MBJ6726684.1 efflux RND transporter periplasmic adaptor subunit [Geomesophilobacter sediminis]